MTAEFIWLDGTKPTAQIRSKTLVVKPDNDPSSLPAHWNFDGSSTSQATGDDSDCILIPQVKVVNPLRPPLWTKEGVQHHWLILCDVHTVEGEPHETNTRHALVDSCKRHEVHAPLFGIEQEYVMIGENGLTMGFQDNGRKPRPQGPYYCSVGSRNAFGRPIAEAHLDACIRAGLKIYGINAEVMPGQWEFQIGTASPIVVADHLILARYLLHRIGEEAGVHISLDPKPVAGDWNGSGAHTNFSSKAMRDREGGWESIDHAIMMLAQSHDVVMPHYGDRNIERLTGHHETCKHDQFRFGSSDRGASIRISPSTRLNRCGYIEDRRPAANVDPYVVTRLIMDAVFS